jgi:peptidoglycan/xylan/chitin deacetylase (PgdA/CDA1 family)
MMLVCRKAVFVAVALACAGCGQESTHASAATTGASGARATVDVPIVLAGPGLPATIRVAVLRDDASEQWYGSAGALDSVVSAWVRAIEELGGRATVAHSSGTATAADVILVPSLPCIGNETRRLLRSEGRDRPGVIVTGLTGTRDAGCRYVGHDLVLALTGAMRADTLGARAEAYVTIPGDMGPLTADIPPGSRVELRPAPQVAWRHPGRPVYWSDWSLNPTPAGDAPLLDAAVVHSRERQPRAVAIGFDVTHVGDRARDRALFARLLTNAILWTARHPVATIAAWPGGARAAAMITQDVEQDFSLAQNALDSLTSAGVPGTYFLVTDLASKHARLVRRLAAQGELGSHGDVHDSLGGRTRAAQEDRLRRSREVIAEVAKVSAAGLRPPSEVMDEATLAAWARLGGDYVFGTNDARSASPELVAVEGDTLVLFGRVTQDDFGALRRAGPSPDPTALAASFLTDFEKVRALGGVYSFSYHSHLLARPALVPAVAAVARGVRRADDTWVARAADVAAWWKARSAVRVVPSLIAGGVVEITLRNTGASALRDAVLSIWPPSAMSAPALEGGRLTMWSADRVTVALPPIAPGATHTVRLVTGGSP